MGSAWGEEVFIHVTWTWLTLPIALEVFAVAFLLSVIGQSGRRNLRAWKSSILAVTRSSSAEVKERLGGLKDNSVMEREAEGFDIGLDNDGDNWKHKIR